MTSLDKAQPPSPAAAPAAVATPTPDGGWQVRRHRAGMRRFVIIGTVIVALGLLAGGAYAVTQRGGGGSTTPAVAGADVSTEPLAVEEIEPPVVAELPAPDRVRIPSIGVDSSLEPLDIDEAGKLKAPSAYTHAGWFAKGPAPGDLGPAVIAGHVDSVSGPAVFARLGELKSGAIVEVSRGGTVVKFSVVAVERYPKAQFPTDKVYKPTPVPELRLITCGGQFDEARRSYQDNFVVYAVVVS